MGLFQKLFGGGANYIPIDIKNDTELVPYQKGVIYQRLSSVSNIEIYEKFGSSGVQIHQQLKIHFETLDFISNNLNDENVLKKGKWDLIGKPQVYLSDYGKLVELLQNTKVFKEYYITQNFNSLYQTILEKNDDFLKEIKVKDLDFEGDKYSYSGGDFNNVYYGFGKSEGKSILKLLDFLFDGKGISTFEKLSKQVIGWNSICLVTPFSIAQMSTSLYDKKLEVVSHNFCQEPIGLFTFIRDGGFENLNIMNTYLDHYQKSLVEDLKNQKEGFIQYLDFSKKIFDLKQESFELGNVDKSFNNDINHIIRFLGQLEIYIESIFDQLIDGKPKIKGLGVTHSRGYIFPNVTTDNLYNHLENNVFEFNVIYDLSRILIESLKSKNNFLYKEIYLLLEPYHIFDKTIEKQTLKELHNLNERLSELNNNLITLNNTITRGFKMLSKQLSSIDNKMSYNNLLTTINTYQLYKISKK